MEIRSMLQYLQGRLQYEAESRFDDRGEGVVQFLIITAAVAVGALAVVAVWSQLINDKAATITLE